MNSDERAKASLARHPGALRVQSHKPKGMRTISHNLASEKKTEEALRESEEKYRLLAENVSDIIWIMDMNLRFTYMSPSVTRVRGYTVEQVMAQSLEEVFTPSSLEAAVKAFTEELAMESLETKDLPRVRTLELEHICKDGSTVWVEVKASFLRDADGQPVGILGVSREITERKQAAEALRRSEKRYRTILEDMEESYYETDLAGNFTLVNDALCYQLGYSKEDMIGMNYLVFTPPEDVKRVSQTSNQVYRTGEPAKCFPREIIRKDGSRTFNETSILPLRNERGEIIGWRGVGRDVTQRKLAEEALRESEEKYRTLFETTPDGILIADLETRQFRYANPAICKNLGYTEQELRTMGVADIHPKEDLQRVVAEFEAQARKEKTLAQDIPCLRKDGTIIYADINSVNITVDGRRCNVGFFRNVTQRKLAEEKLRQARQQTEMILNSAGEGILGLDMQGKYLFVNQAAAKMLDFKVDELIGKDSHSTSHYQKPDGSSYNKDECPIHESLKDGKIHRLDTEVFWKKDDTSFPVEYVSTPILEEDKIIGTVVVFNDITERKQTEETIRIQRDLAIDLGATISLDKAFKLCLKAAITSARLDSGGIYLIDPATGAVDLVCHEGLPSEFVKLVSHFEPDSPNARLFMEGKPSYLPVKELDPLIAEPLISEGLGVLAVVPVWHQKRVIACLNVTSHTLKDVPASARVLLEIIAAQIGDTITRIRTREALQASEVKYRTILEEIEDSYFEVDLAGNFTFVNDATCLNLRYSREELLGMNYRNFTDKEDIEHVYHAFNEVYRTGEPNKGFLWKVITKDGSVGFVEALVTLLRSQGGEIIGFRGVGRDITERKLAEEALRESEDRYRDLVDHSHDLICTHDLEGRILSANPCAVRVLGYGLDTILQMNARDFLIPEFRGGFDAYLAEIQKQGAAEGLLTVQTATGERRIWEFDNTLRVEGVTAPVVRGIARDVTERKKTEDVLRSSEERFRKIGETSIDIIFLIDKQGIITYCSPSIEKILGIRPEDRIGKHFSDFWLLEPQGAQDLFESLMRGDSIRNLEVSFIHKSGKPVPIEVNVSPVIEDGEMKSVYGIARDITQRKRAEQALKQSEERYRLLVDNANEAIIVAQDGMLKFVNQNAIDLSGYSREELASVSFVDIIHPDDRDMVVERYLRRLKGESLPSAYPFRAIDKKGNIKWAEINAVSIIWEGKPATLNFLTDITERKNAEQQALVNAKLASVGELVAGVAHEINNPLTAILGYAQLLEERQDVPQNVKDDLQKIYEESQRMIKIVKNLLGFARQYKPEKSLVDISELIERTLELEAYKLRTSNIELSTHLAANLPLIVADYSQLQQVILNIIVNAEQAMAETKHKGKIAVTTGVIGDYVRISIADIGPGIEPENMTKIFDPFFTTKPVGSGSGLGLSVCYGIITEHGGNIYAESTPGKGTKFIIELPITTGEQAIIREKEPAKKRSRHPRRKMTGNILIVEDEPSIRAVLIRNLSADGYQVQAVSDGKAALARLAKNTYDLIFTDLKMPGISGRELYETLKKKHPNSAKRVVFITGDVMRADTHDFLASIGRPYLVKPFDSKDVMSVIEKVLAGNKR